MGSNEDHYSKASHELSECRIQLKQSEKSAVDEFSTYIKLSVVSILMEGHLVILVYTTMLFNSNNYTHAINAQDLSILDSGCYSLFWIVNWAPILAAAWNFAM